MGKRTWDDIKPNDQHSDDYKDSSARMLKNHPGYSDQCRMAAVHWIMETGASLLYVRPSVFAAIQEFDRLMLAEKNVPPKDVHIIAAGCLNIVCRHTGDNYADIPKYMVKPCTLATLNELGDYIFEVNYSKNPPELDSLTCLIAYLGEVTEADVDRCIQTLELAVLSIQSVNFAPRILASSVIAVILGVDKFKKWCKLNEADIVTCVKWLKPFLDAAETSRTAKKKPSKSMVANKFKAQIEHLQKAGALPPWLSASESQPKRRRVG